MAEKCFCHLNGYKVKDATARDAIAEVEAARKRSEIELEKSIGVERARINALTSLPAGSTAGNAELVDIRIDVEGTEHATAGEAVRAQINRLPYPREIVTDATDLDEMLTPGCYILNAGIELIHKPELPHFQPFYLVVEQIHKNDAGSIHWLIQRLGHPEWQTEYRRVFQNGTFHGWLSSDGVLCPQASGTDMMEVMQNALNRTKHLKLAAGTYEISPITMPEGSVIEGAGASTIIKTIGDSVTALTAKSNCTIKNLKFSGQFTSQPEEGQEKTKNEVGVYVTGATDTVIIENCIFDGLSHSGIWLQKSGTSVKSVAVNNCEFINCDVGCRIVASEYGCFTNCIFRDNRIGIYNFGGNNKFAACGFDSNEWGFVVSGDTNNGHGSAVGCSFNHNNNKAISLQGVKYGYIFSGCQVHDGLINYSGDSKGILFSGCNFGTAVAHDLSGKPSYYVGCTFFANPRTVEGFNDPSGNARFVNCYDYDGNEIE